MEPGGHRLAGLGVDDFYPPLAVGALGGGGKGGEERTE
jgi:hypothetical protein